MRDLLVITPSRGRPQRLTEMLDATLSLSRAATDVAVAHDRDDPEFAGYLALSASLAEDQRVLWYSGPRRSLTGWTNHVALEQAPHYRAVASLGDDHLPRTEGWDKMLLDAIREAGGTGIGYGDDLLQRTLPTAAVVTCDIVMALGWMCLPGTSHYCVDNTWLDLGQEAGCLAHRPEVIIEHMHPHAGKAPSDATYNDAGGFSEGHPDWVTYQDWRAGRMAADVATVKGLL